MKPARIVLDFIPASGRPGALALGLLVAGVLVIGWSFLAYRDAADQSAGLSLRLAEATGRSTPATAAGSSRAVAEAQAVARELQTPWVGLLDDLESATAAGKGNVVLVSVEPDRRHGKLKLVAEARSLPAALQYVQRLQHKTAIRDALLESHQVRSDAPERPVRVQIVADWRMGS